MIQLRDKDTREHVGSIAPEDLQFLVDNLVEESSDDTDYYFDRVTIDLLRDRGASDSLIEALETALSDREGIEIEWSRT